MEFIIARRDSRAQACSGPYFLGTFYSSGVWHLRYGLRSFVLPVAFLFMASGGSGQDWMDGIWEALQDIFQYGETSACTKQTQTDGLADRQAEIYTEGVRGERARGNAL